MYGMRILETYVSEQIINCWFSLTLILVESDRQKKGDQHHFLDLEVSIQTNKETPISYNFEQIFNCWLSLQPALIESE